MKKFIAGFALVACAALPTVAFANSDSNNGVPGAGGHGGQRSITSAIHLTCNHYDGYTALYNANGWDTSLLDWVYTTYC